MSDVCDKCGLEIAGATLLFDEDVDSPYYKKELCPSCYCEELDNIENQEG